MTSRAQEHWESRRGASEPRDQLFLGSRRLATPPSAAPLGASALNES